MALSDNEISLVQKALALQEALAYRLDTPSASHRAEIRAFLEKMQTRQLMWEAEK